MEGLPQMYAWDTLHDPKVAGELDSRGVYDLCKQAGLSEEAAREAAIKHEWERMKRKE